MQLSRETGILSKYLTLHLIAGVALSPSTYMRKDVTHKVKTLALVVYRSRQVSRRRAVDEEDVNRLFSWPARLRGQYTQICPQIEAKRSCPWAWSSEENRRLSRWSLWQLTEKLSTFINIYVIRVRSETRALSKRVWASCQTL